MCPSRNSPRRLLVAGVAVLAGLSAGGCAGGGDRSASSSSSHRPATRSTTTTSRTIPTAATSPVSTTTTSTSDLPGSGRPTVTIGDKNYSEQFVLGQLYLQALRAQGFEVNISQNIGPPAVVAAALKSGTLAMYPDYLSTFVGSMAHVHRRFAHESDAFAAADRWAGAHGLTLLSPTPFSTTTAIAVTVAYGARHHLRSLVDLRRVGPQLVLGGATPLAHLPPGLPTLANAYGVTPAAFTKLGVGDQYAHLNDGSVQAAYVTSTDGELASGDYRLLADPKRVFGWGNVVPVLSSAALAKEGPAFAATIERVDAMLTRSAMRSMNAAVDLGRQDPAAVAKQFLQTHGLLEPLAGFAPPRTDESTTTGAETTGSTG